MKPLLSKSFNRPTPSVKIIIENSLQKLVENGTHPFIILRFVEKLKTSLSELNKEKITSKEWDNRMQALNLLNDCDVNKLIGAKIKNK